MEGRSWEREKLREKLTENPIVSGGAAGWFEEPEDAEMSCGGHGERYLRPKQRQRRGILTEYREVSEDAIADRESSPVSRWRLAGRAKG